MSLNPQTSCFDRWKISTKNPDATEAEYFAAVEEHKKIVKKKGGSFLPPNVATLPDGVVVSKVGISSAEIRSINHEHVQQCFGQQ
jgi:hypothetical protein